MKHIVIYELHTDAYAVCPQVEAAINTQGVEVYNPPIASGMQYSVALKVAKQLSESE